MDTFHLRARRVIGFQPCYEGRHLIACGFNKFLGEGRAEKVVSCIYHFSAGIKSCFSLVSACSRRSHI